MGQLLSTIATSSRRTAAGVRVITSKNVKFGEGHHRGSDPEGHFVIGIYQRQGIMAGMGGIFFTVRGGTNLKFYSRQPTFISVFH
jgi:hypothetical protein